MADSFCVETKRDFGRLRTECPPCGQQQIVKSLFVIHDRSACAVPDAGRFTLLPPPALPQVQCWLEELQRSDGGAMVGSTIFRRQRRG